MDIGNLGVPVINIKVVNGGRIGGNEIVSNPHEAVNVVANELVDYVREVVYVMNIDAKGHVLSIYQAGLGTTDHAMVTGKDIFQAAILSNASSIILIHNHPGQDPTPSQADILLTLSMKNIGMLLGIDLADHIIVAGGNSENIFSFRENNLFKRRKKHGQNKNIHKRNNPTDDFGNLFSIDI